MLILSRRVGVEASKDVSVHREEVYQRVLQEKQRV